MPEKTIQIRLTFLEPYRLVEKDGATNPRYLRGRGFAQWVKGCNGKGGKPSIAGTLLRSATIKAAEGIISLSGGRWNDTDCCNGEFFTKIDKPSVLRKRHTLQWKSGTGIDICNDATRPCPLCLLLGRFDDAGKNHKVNKSENTDHHIHFSNLYPGIKEKTAIALEDVASQRILNRVDYKTGKAHDYFKLWEVDDENARVFTGKVTIRNEGLAAEGLLTDAIRFVDRLCGALCTIEITETPRTESHQESAHASTASDVKTEPHREDDAPAAGTAFPQESGVVVGLSTEKTKEVTRASSEENRKHLKAAVAEITQAFQFSHKIEKLRTFADVVRAMRTKTPEILDKLPTGKDAKNHHLWDIDVGGTSLKAFLNRLWLAHDPRFDWRTFCTSLGNELYFQYKNATGTLSAKYRILGETEYYPEGDDGEKAQDKDLFIPLTPPSQAQDVCEWIFVGDLKAATPFYFGAQSSFGSNPDGKDKKTENEQGKDANGRLDREVNDQTSFRILLDKKGHYRIPRSLIRGVLRRDLRTAFDGSGCNSELGGHTP